MAKPLSQQQAEATPVTIPPGDLLVLPPDISQDSTAYVARLQLLFVGDSLTQRGSEPDGWCTLMNHYYSRKADSINRGYSGYNTNHIRAMVEQHIAYGIWPTSHAVQSSSSPASSSALPSRRTLMTLCLGANDSCLPQGPSSQQSVTVEQYRANLAGIIALIKGEDGRSTPEVHLILIGPPQCDVQTWGLVSKQRHGLAEIPITRDNAHTKLYSEAARSVAEQFRVPFIDMYSLTSDWANLLVDGLHFTPKGNFLLFQQIKKTIQQSFPELQAEKLPLDSFPFLKIEPTTLEDTQRFFKEQAKGQAQADKKPQQGQ